MASPARAGPAAWLYGPVPDLLLGCGLWYALALALLAGPGDAVRRAGGMALMPFVVLFFSTPHYGATLLRVYEQREDRRAYVVFAVWASLLLAALFVAGVYSPRVGSLVLTAYITWSPWHYTGQNYGIAVMFLRRRGVPLPPAVKRVLYASFLLSYLLTFVALHSGAEGGLYAPLAFDDVDTYRFLRLGLPAPLSDAAFSVLAAAYAAAVVAAAALLLRRAPARDLAPAGALVLTQALWFSVPLILRSYEIRTGIDPWESEYGTYYFLWIATGHAVQYVWITSWYARAGSHWRGAGRYLAKGMLAGAALWTLPALLFAPGALGGVGYDAGLGLLVAAAVNLHHFVLDGAIWKLRDGRVARVLLRSRDAPADTPEPGGRPWLAPAVYALGAVSFAIMFGMKWEHEFGLRRAAERGDLQRARAALERLAWVGRDSAVLHHQLANALLLRGRDAEALAEYQRALALGPGAATWQAIGQLHARGRRWEEAASAFEQAASLGAEDDRVFYELGRARLRLGDPGRAALAFERAVALNPERGINRIMLERAWDAARAAPSAAPPDAGRPGP
jgi:tetratricopeptide (TPR) repeat protein